MILFLKYIIMFRDIMVFIWFILFLFLYLFLIISFKKLYMRGFCMFNEGLLVRNGRFLY